VPIVRLELPEGLWIGNKLGCVAREHFVTRSMLKSGMAQSLCAIPVAALGSETGSPHGAAPAEAAQNPWRGHDPVGQFRAAGFMTTGANDKIYFAEPSGAAYALTKEDLKELVDEMFRIVHQMAQSISSTRQALGRSGASKEQDRSALAVILAYLGSKVRGAAVKVYSTISRGRRDNVIWTAHGLDKYDLEDRETMLEEATLLGTVNLYSKTAKKLWARKCAFGILGDIPPDTKETISSEQEKQIDQEGEMAKLLQQQAQEPVVQPRATPKTNAAQHPSSQKPKPGQPQPGRG